MKCPKCGYLGFEPVERCRNCGYDFSLSPSSAPIAPLELPLKSESDRLPLIDDMSFGRASPDAGVPTPDLASMGEEWPLFSGHLSDDLPLITTPSQPRTPLAVRRSTPDVGRARVTPPRMAALDLDAPSAVRVPPPAISRPPSGSLPVRPVADRAQDASLFARLVAAVLDVAILGAIDAIVVYFTMQICGVGLADIAVLPRIPLLAFFLVQNVGYLVVFTAGGQTLGKMVARIRVVSTEPRSSVDLSSACARELAWLVLAAPAGLGLLTVFTGDHRGIHDRFAGTRVVRVAS